MRVAYCPSRTSSAFYPSLFSLLSRHPSSARCDLSELTSIIAGHYWSAVSAVGFCGDVGTCSDEPESLSLSLPRTDRARVIPTGPTGTRSNMTCQGMIGGW